MEIRVGDIFIKEKYKTHNNEMNNIYAKIYKIYNNNNILYEYFYDWGSETVTICSNSVSKRIIDEEWTKIDKVLDKNNKEFDWQTGRYLEK